MKPNELRVNPLGECGYSPQQLMEIMMDDMLERGTSLEPDPEDEGEMDDDIHDDDDDDDEDDIDDIFDDDDDIDDDEDEEDDD